jgi:hypothetical protein
MAVDDITARAHDNSNDGSTPSGGGESDRLGPGIWKIIAVTVAGAFMTQLSTTMVNVSVLKPRGRAARQPLGDPVGDQRLSAGAGPDAAAKRLAVIARQAAVVTTAELAGAFFMNECVAIALSACPLLRGQPPGRSTASR